MRRPICFLLRVGRFEVLDIAHLLEELEGMGRSEQHELTNRLEILLAHLLKAFLD